MVQVTVRNTGPAIRAIPNIDRQMVTLKPGDARGIDMHAHTAMLLEREAAKADPSVELHMSPEEGKAYREELEVIRGRNRKASEGRRELARARPIASKPVPVRVDKRFITDPDPGSIDPPAPPKAPPADASRQRKAAKRVALKTK